MFRQKRSVSERPFRRRVRRKVGSRARKVRKYEGVRKALAQAAFRGPSGLPDRQFVKFKLAFTIETTNTSGAYSSFVVTNDLNDPLGATSAIQPYLYDQWQTLYTEYRVNGIGVRAQPHMGATGVTSTSARRAGICLATRTTAFTSMSMLQEQPYSKVTTWAVNSQQPDLRMYYPVNRIFGQPWKEFIGNPNYIGLMGSTAPSSVIGLHLGSDDPYVAANCTTQWTITVTFYCTLFNRQEPAQS